MRAQIAEYIKSLKSGSEKQRVQAAEAISVAAYQNTINQDAIREDGGLPILLRILKNTDLNTDMRMHAARALTHMAENSKNQDAIFKMNGLSPLFLCLRDHDNSVRENAAFALAILSDNPTIMAAIIEAKMLAKVIKCLENANETILRDADMSLKKLKKQAEASLPACPTSPPPFNMGRTSSHWLPSKLPIRHLAMAHYSDDVFLACGTEVVHAKPTATGEFEVIKRLRWRGNSLFAKRFENACCVAVLPEDQSILVVDSSFPGIYQIDLKTSKVGLLYKNYNDRYEKLVVGRSGGRLFIYVTLVHNRRGNNYYRRSCYLVQKEDGWSSSDLDSEEVTDITISRCMNYLARAYRSLSITDLKSNATYYFSGTHPCQTVRILDSESSWVSVLIAVDKEGIKWLGWVKETCKSHKTTVSVHKEQLVSIVKGTAVLLDAGYDPSGNCVVYYSRDPSALGSQYICRNIAQNPIADISKKQTSDLGGGGGSKEPGSVSKWQTEDGAPVTKGDGLGTLVFNSDGEGGGGGGGGAKEPALPLAEGMGMIPFAELTYDPVTHFIAAGGYGKVYKASWQGVPVALKVLLMQEVEGEALAELLHESAMMTKLRHPHVIDFYGACMEPGHYGLVMAYMPKGSLYKVLHNPEEILDWPARSRISHGVSAGIAYLHERDILHRDLKSLNVLMDKDNMPKIADFGLSKLKKETTTKKTQGGAVGTLAWMAPELLEPGIKYSSACDIYSLAVILYEIASRKAPWEGAHMPALIPLWVAQGKREDIPVDTPKPMAALIAKCWAQKPGERPAIAEVVAELGELQAAFAR